MKTDTLFVPATPLEERIHAGDFDGVIAALRAMSYKERKAQHARTREIRERVVAAGWESDGKIKAWWGSDPSREQTNAACAALFFCGDSQERAEQWRWRTPLYPYLDMLEPAVLRGFAAELVAALPHFMPTAHRMVLDGLSDRPASSDEFIIGFIGAVRGERDDGNPILRMVEEDPALLDGPLMRIFEVEGDGRVNMAAVEKYSRGDNNWTYALLELVRAGKLTRAWLIERCLFTLEKDWPQFRAGWFSRFHDKLAPTLDEMAPLCERYLGLCHSRIPPTVTLVLGALAALFKDGRVDSAPLLDALAPVMSSAIKGQVDAALKLLDQVVKKTPGLAHAASSLAGRALAHESADLHKKVIARLSIWGFDDATRDELEAMLPFVSAVHRASLAALTGSAAQAAQEAAPPQAQLETGVLPPLDPSRKLAPLDDLDELVQTIAFVFENECETDEFERALGALARLGPGLASESARFSPVRKRALKMLAGERDIGAALAQVLAAALEGTVQVASLDARSSNADLARRIADLTVFMAQKCGLAPLSSATHRRGFIDPLVLAELIAAHAAAGAASSLDEQVRALLRLPSGPAPEALRRLGELAQTPFVQACRYALGDEVAIGAERALFLAAARVRFPDQDDMAMLAAYGDMGADGALAARYDWSAQDWGDEFAGSYHVCLKVAPPPTALDPSLIAMRRHGTHERFDHYFSWGESNLLYAASIIPGSLEAFFADGAYEIAFNIDWWEARWHDKAYLSMLMDRTVPVTPTALKMLAFALGGKEPGQTGMAIDAFVGVVLERRADVLAVGAEIGWVLRSLLGKGARYAKSLGNAARAHPAMPAGVCAALCTVVDSGDAVPSKEMGPMLELLLELSVGNNLALPAGTRDKIALLKLTGKSKAAQKELLARFS